MNGHTWMQLTPLGDQVRVACLVGMDAASWLQTASQDGEEVFVRAESKSGALQRDHGGYSKPRWGPDFGLM